MSSGRNLSPEEKFFDYLQIRMRLQKNITKNTTTTFRCAKSNRFVYCHNGEGVPVGTTITSNYGKYTIKEKDNDIPVLPSSTYVDRVNFVMVESGKHIRLTKDNFELFAPPCGKNGSAKFDGKEIVTNNVYNRNYVKKASPNAAKKRKKSADVDVNLDLADKPSGSKNRFLEAQPVDPQQETIQQANNSSNDEINLVTFEDMFDDSIFADDQLTLESLPVNYQSNFDEPSIIYRALSMENSSLFFSPKKRKLEEEPVEYLPTINRYDI